MEQVMKEGYIPKNQRKKILLLSDDCRMPSGVGVMSREIILKTSHVFNWVQVAAALQHPEMGNVVDSSEAVSKEIGIPDASLKIYPYSGYGDPALIRYLLATEKPDGIVHFTDPRYWIWLYQIEHEIREHVPLMFYHVWDDLPYPKYNEDFYRSCDWIASISKQTHNIVRQVWKKDAPEAWQTSYVPHGIDETRFFRYTEEEDLKRVAEMKKNMFGADADKVKYVVLYNNRNIRRKMTGDVILAYREFVSNLPEDKRDECRLVLHTQPVDDNGTDLIALIRDVAPEIRVVFSPDRLDTRTMNDLYNVSDVVINLASNEGFGLGTLEAIMTERLIVANVTGGLQDQMGFVDENGQYLNPEVHFCEEWGSNHDGRYKKHGEWAFPCFPVQRALIGSPPTPYIFDDRCSWEDAGKQLRAIYDLSPEERIRRGKLGRAFAIDQQMTAEAMGENFIKGITTTLENWTPRKRFSLLHT
jgi:glycosyltransferase involved in cell wall biosynthesis